MADLDYGYGDAQPAVDYGYGTAAADSTNYGYGDGTPKATDYGYGDATPETTSGYGYGDATPDYGYGGSDDYGYGSAAPNSEYGYGESAPEPAKKVGSVKRRCSVTKYNLVSAPETSTEAAPSPEADEKSSIATAATSSCDSTDDIDSHHYLPPSSTNATKAPKKSMMNKIRKRLSIAF
jgi:hypothetical protein